MPLTSLDFQQYREGKELEESLKKMVEERRWAKVTSTTPVVFEGNLTTWGELGTTERKCCRFDNQGQLVGEYQ